MKLYLSNNMIDYVWEHFSLSYNINYLKDKFVYLKDPDFSSIKNKVVLQLSEKDIDFESIITIDEIPILYPLSNKKSFYTIENDSLIFHHDILKSAFYLLSGYQEYNNIDRDEYDRFKYESSVQYKLGIIQRPIVNYYFQIIFEGLNDFCKLNKHPILIQNKLFTWGCFNLTHDFDKLDKYGFYNTIGYFKQFLFSKKPLKSRISELLTFYKNTLKSKSDPHLSFDFLLDLEKKYNIKATYFILDKIHKRDASYSLNEPRIRNILNNIISEGHEIAIHGSYDSYTNFEISKISLKKIENITSSKVLGNRQHYLRYKMPYTPNIHQAMQFKYDASLGFVEHEGFRNSYCLPFKLYNFSIDKAYNVWQIPLNIMDSTIFFYRYINYSDTLNNIKFIIEEIIKFGGIFSILWHNNCLDELEMPGVRNFYSTLLSEIVKYKIECLNCKEILERLENSSKKYRVR